MDNYFLKVKDFLFELDHSIVSESEEDGVFVIENESKGLKNMVLAIADPILVIEEYLFDLKNPSAEIYKALLKKNREIVHGAFVLDETGTKVIYRDSLEMENLDLNELEGSLNSLSLLLSEYSDELISYSK